MSRDHRDHHDHVRRQFAASAERYRTSATHARGRSLERLLDLAEPKTGWTVLDAATGAGHTAATLAPHVALVVAGDMTREMLAQAALVVRERGLGNIRFVRENAQALAYRDRVFDLVTCRVAAHHFPQPGRFVAEAARVLRPGGRLVVIDNLVPEDPAPAGWLNDFERRRDPSHAQCLSLEQWRRCFRDQGLGMLHVEVSGKRFDFREWMARMNASEPATRRMGEELLAAPDPVRAFWEPATDAGRIGFTLREAILVGAAA